MPSRIVISGASGLIGRSLVPLLDSMGHQTARLVRAANNPKPVIAPNIAWDPSADRIDTAALIEFAPDAVIHLAGETVFGRWNAAKKRHILDSRVLGTRALMRAIAALDRPPPVVLSASAVGYYGDTGDREADESYPSGDGFLAEVCRAWEAETLPAENSGSRVVHLRIGVVLSREGGALHTLLPAYEAGLGGPIAGGRAWLPWISLDDTLRAIIEALENPSLRSPLNVVGPHPVTQHDFSRTLAHILHRPAILPVPRWLISATMGEMARETALKSVRAVPRLLESTGFAFRHPTIESALRHALQIPPAS